MTTIRELALPALLKERIVDTGFLCCSELVDIPQSQLARELGVSESIAHTIIAAARLGSGTSKTRKHVLRCRSALDIAIECSNLRSIYTLCKPIDQALGGGIPVGKLTQFVGAPSTGKSQLAMQLACSVQIPLEGLECSRGCIYIDTEGGFSWPRTGILAERVISKIKKVNPGYSECIQDFIDRMTLERVYDLTDLLRLIKALPTRISELPYAPGLIVLDSLAYVFRQDTTDGSRNNLISQVTQELLHIAQRFNVAVIIVNHMVHHIIANDEIDLIPALGFGWSQSCAVELAFGYSDSVLRRQRAVSVHTTTNYTSDIPFTVSSKGIK